MLFKYLLVFAIFVLFVEQLSAKPTLQSEKESTKKIRCFKPDKPNDMPQDVYEKYKISSKNLNEQDKKDFWDKFVNWWKNVFAQIGKFFEKVGKFFKSIFSKKQKATTTTPSTEAPPTPNPQQAKKDDNILICVEYEDDPKGSNTMVTTKVYEVSSPLTTNIEKLVTKVTSMDDLITTVTTQALEITTHQDPTPLSVPESTPFNPNDVPNKENVPVIIGTENKAEVKEEETTDAVIVKAV